VFAHHNSGLLVLSVSLSSHGPVGNLDLECYSLYPRHHTLNIQVGLETRFIAVVKLVLSVTYPFFTNTVRRVENVRESTNPSDER
jgi:hypothetical protein